jgi:hypothetical protein
VEPGLARSRERRRSADWQSAVSRIGNPPGVSLRRAPETFSRAVPCRLPADCQSATQQVANLRYFAYGFPTSEFGLKHRPGAFRKQAARRRRNSQAWTPALPHLWKCSKLRSAGRCSALRSLGGCLRQTM